MEPNIFIPRPPKCNLPKIGRKLERKCKGQKVLLFWTTLSPCATVSFFLLVLSFLSLVFLNYFSIVLIRFFFFFLHFFPSVLGGFFFFFFHLFFPLICFVLLYFIIFYNEVTIHTQFFNKNNNMLLFVYLIRE